METIGYPPYMVVLLTPGRPYLAQIEMNRWEGTRWNACSGFVARDSAGRERLEIHMMPNVALVTIKDPVGQKLYTIDPANQAFVEQPYPPEMQMWSYDAALPPGEKEKQVIEGIECYRYDCPLRVGDGPTKWITDWMSNEVGLMAEEFTSSTGVKGSYKLHHIVLEEPAADLFTVPEGLQRAE